MNSDNTLEQLLKSKKISQLTFDKVTIAKKYIERKYNLKTVKNIEWNTIMEKIKLSKNLSLKSWENTAISSMRAISTAKRRSEI